MGRRAQASLEYMLMFAVGMLIAAIIIYKLIGVKGLAIWAGSQMNSTGEEISESLQNLSNTTR
ncbi:class III signal peptide-containing protein [Thermococcus barossii]|uniref:class III signal peptide-containing protein n=1 Tax=Thermococcus barossii TaxID=54077 RepID=UPI0012FE4CB7|nr:class III signal peptide-containing protein [Thermococcus barossii]